MEKHEIRHEVELAIRYCEELRGHLEEIDTDEVEHLIKKIELALMRCNKEFLQE